MLSSGNDIPRKHFVKKTATYLNMSHLNQEGSNCHLPTGECSSTEKSLKHVPPERPPHPAARVKSQARHQSPLKLPAAEKQKVGQASESASCVPDSERLYGNIEIPDKPKDLKKADKLCINIITQPSQFDGKGIKKSASSCSVIKLPKPAPRLSREHACGSVISVNNGVQDREKISTDVSELNLKVNSSSKSAEDSVRKISAEGKMKLNLPKQDAVNENISERRRTVAGHEIAAQCKTSIEGAKGDKPTPPQKPDFGKRHSSLRTSKELEDQLKVHQGFRHDNGSESSSTDTLLIDFSKDSITENFNKTNPLPIIPPATPVRSISFNVATKSGSPAKPCIPIKKPDIKKYAPESKETPMVAQRSATLPDPPTTSLSLLQPMTTAPPKPPRTHAHDDYLRNAVSLDLCGKRSEISNQTAARKSEPTLASKFMGGEFLKITKSPSIRDKLSKMQQPKSPSSPLSSSPTKINIKEGIILANSKPSRPPPPKRRSASDEQPNRQPFLFHTLSEQPKTQEDTPVSHPVPCHSPKCQRKQLPNTHHLHSRHPNDKLPPKPEFRKSLRRLPLQKSFSSDCLHPSDFSSMKNELGGDDKSDSARSSCYGSQYIAVIDPDGYAVPNAFMHLPVKQSNVVRDENIVASPRKFFRRTQRKTNSDDVSVLGDVVTSIQEQNLGKVNKKTMIMVRQKINQAYADVNTGPEGLPDRPNSDWEFVEHGPDTNELVIGPTVLKKRIEYCASVRRRSTKSIRRSKEYLSVIYPQLFEYCFVVGLRQLVGEDGYEAYVMHKFPENVSGNLSVPSFCFPDASVFKPGSATSFSESYSFAMTSSDGSRVYGYCRRIQPKDTSLPEVVCIVSPLDAVNMYNTLLSEIEARRCVSFDLATELIAASFGRPLPKPGKVCHIRTLDSNGELETIFLSRLSDSRLENVNYESPLRYLGTDKLVKVFSSMLMERRIILYSSNLSVLTQTVHALCALLYPFHWQHVYIPILPDEMLDAVCAPMPFIVGVLSCFLPRVYEMDLEEVLIVDLDKKMIVKSQGDESTILPKRIQKALKSAINMCKIDAEAHKSQWLMVNEAFLRMFIETIGHFAKYICVQQDGNRIFQKEGFILDVVSKERKEFLEWFTETQMFEVFVMEHLDNSDSKTSDLFMQRLTEYKESKEESGRQKGLGTKVKNLGKALKTVLQSS